MDIGSVVVILSGGLLATGVIAWTIGSIRAVQAEKQRFISERLNAYCRRSG